MTRGHVTMMALGAMVLAALAVIAIPALRHSTAIPAAIFDPPCTGTPYPDCTGLLCPNVIRGVCVPEFDLEICDQSEFEGWLEQNNDGSCWGGLDQQEKDDLYWCWRKNRCDALTGTDCENLRELLSLGCDPVSAVCDFLLFCDSGFDSCDDLDDIIICIEGNGTGDPGCALTLEQVEAIAECLGVVAEDECEPQESCCQEIETTGVYYNACSGTVACDQNCDGIVDCDDLRAFLNASWSECNSGTMSRSNFLDLVCVFMTACAGQGDICEQFENCITSLLEEFIDETEPGLTGEERSHFDGSENSCADCLGGGEIEICDDVANPAEPDEDACPAGEQASDCDNCGGRETTGKARTDTGMELVTGDQVLTETDLSIAMTGSDLNISRSYRSSKDYDCDKGGVGRKWTLSELRRLDYDADTDVMTLFGSAVSTPRITGYDGTGQVTWNGPTTMTVEPTTVGGSVDVWRLEVLGRWQEDYYRNASEGSLEGRLKETRDIHGNRKVYDYTIYPGANSTDWARLDSITLKDASDATQGVVYFVWDMDTSSGSFQRLRQIKVVRTGGESEDVLTDRVVYTYASDDPEFSDDIGTGSDLVQVLKWTRVDRLLGSDTGDIDAVPRRQLITQYRYHRAAAEDWTLTERGYDMEGDDGQIKMIIQPEQIEFWAQEYNKEATTPVLPRVAALELLTKADDEILWTAGGNDVLTVDLASSVFAEYSASNNGPIETTYVQSACGCGGSGTTGLKVTSTTVSYDPLPSGLDINDGKTITVTEALWDGEDWVTHRTLLYDMERQGGGTNPSDPDPRDFYVVNSVIRDGADAERQWMTRYIYVDDTRQVEAEYTPASLSNYGHNGGVPEFTLQSGLVHGSEYNADRRLIGRYIKNGYDPDLDTFPDDFIQIEKIEYGDAGADWDADNSRDHLVSQRTRYRIEGGTPGANDLEITKFFYGFHTTNGNDIAWIETAVEAELEAENGPGGTYYTAVILDDRGRTLWSRAADGSLTKYTDFHAQTGAPQTIIRNHDGTGVPLDVLYNDLHPDTDDWDDTAREGQGGSLTTTYVYDLLGRVQQVISPSGVSTYTLREMREWPERPGLLYFATVSLSHEWTVSTTTYHASPARVSWQNAGGASIGSSSFDLEGDPYGSPTTGGYELVISDWNDEGAELSRSATVHHYSGPVQAQQVWHDVANDGFYETTYEYDDLGRVEFTTSPEGTVTQQVYDVLGRTIAVKVGTDPETVGNMLTVSETFYDGLDAGDPDDVQGVGNGHVTFVRQHIDGGTTRDSRFWHDFRGRRYKTMSALAPHEWVVYDNLDRVVERGVFESEPDDIDDPLADRKSYSVTFYSQRGLTYRSQTAIDPTDGTPDFLESHTWYDATGRSVGSLSPTGPMQKMTYDGLGRAVASYLSDRGSDAAPGGSGNYADVHDVSIHAADLTDDVVFQESATRYIVPGDYTNDSFTGLADLMTTRLRTHAATDAKKGSLAALADVEADDICVITTYSASFYDAANRPIRAAHYGTNRSDGWAHSPHSTNDEPTIDQDSPPDWDTGGAEIVTHTDYGVRGVADTTTDPKGRLTKVIFDDMGRQIAVIENWDDADISGWNSGDQRWNLSGFSAADQTNARDRVTTFVYNGSGQVVKQIAHLFVASTEKLEETQYIYGVTTGQSPASGINSPDLLREVRYPDESTGAAGSTSAYKVIYSYDRAGQMLTMTDQNGTVHAYSYNARGQLTVDEITSFGTDIDDAIDAIVTTYDDLGRRSKVTSYNDYAGTPAVVNEVAFIYDDGDLGVLTEVRQQHDGVTSGGSPTVTYTYDTDAMGSGNLQRLLSVEYPSGFTPSMDYGSGSNATISRLKSMRWTDSTPTTHQIVAYDYIGLSMPAVVDYALSSLDVQLDPSAAHNGARAPGNYPGSDRFGRVVKQLWVDGNYTTHGSSGTVPNIPPIVEIDYAYCKGGHRLSIKDGRPGAKRTNRHALATTDTLDRLVEYRRGVEGIGFAYDFGSQKWTYDFLGNMVMIERDLTGDGDYGDTNEVENRTHNLANELLGRDIDDDATDEVTFTLDHAGNIRTSDDGTTVTTYTHDGWNRLVKVVVDSGAGDVDRTENWYNGLNWRVIQRVDSDLVGGLDEQRVMVYNASWQLVEEEIYEGWSSGTPGSVDERRAYVWGARYIDDLVQTLVDGHDGATPDGDYEDAAGGDDAWFFHLHDAQFSVVAVMDAVGGVLERVTYDAYGEARHHDWRDVDGDGDYDATDRGIIASIPFQGYPITNANYNADADLNRDGVVNATDITLSTTTYPTPLAKGELSYAHVGGRFGYDGYRFDPERREYKVRHRDYSPILMRWMQRDPAGYVDGWNLFDYSANSPLVHGDPWGLFKVKIPQIHEGITLDAVRQFERLFRSSEDVVKIVEANFHTDLGPDFFAKNRHSQNPQFVDAVSDVMMDIQTADCRGWGGIVYTTDKILQLIGTTLHTLQDFYSHTDWIDGSTMEYYYYHAGHDALGMRASRQTAHGDRLISLDEIQRRDGSSFTTDRIIYYVGGEAGNLGEGKYDAHQNFAADKSGFGRARAHPSGLGSGAYDSARRSATSTSVAFLRWVYNNLTSCCRKVIFTDDDLSK